MPEQKENWIDLITLAQRIRWCDCCNVVKIEEVNVSNHEVYMYSLRVALRSVGHQIKKVNKYYNKDNNLDIVAYETTISYDEFKEAMQHFDDWVHETYHDFNENDDADETIEEENPSV